MKTNYVLIDYENVQPKNLALLDGHPFKVLVFLGESQARLLTEFADAMQAMGKDACYVRMTGNGRNALDFHIAYHLGELSTNDPEGYFHVISKDTGFDPLIGYLRKRNIRIQRSERIEQIPMLRLSLAKTMGEKLDAIVDNLAKRGSARPRKWKTLASTISALFMNEIEESELRALVDGLVKRGAIAVEGGKITYSL